MVRKYSTFAYRSYATCPKTGEPIVQYHPTEAEARRQEQKLRKEHAMHRPIWVKRNVQRRRDASAQDLPVGFQDRTIINSSGNTKRAIVCYFSWEGKPKQRTRYYGEKRTRDEAIDELIIAMTKLFKQPSVAGSVDS